MRDVFEKMPNCRQFQISVLPVSLLANNLIVQATPIGYYCVSVTASSQLLIVIILLVQCQWHHSISIVPDYIQGGPKKVSHHQFFKKSY